MKHFLYPFQGVAFYTQAKTITSLWREDVSEIKKTATVMPTMK